MVSPDEATIHVVSRKLFHEVMGGVAALPQWAGQRFKSAEVLIAYKGDVPLIVAVAERRIEQLTETGIIDADFDNLKLTPRTSQPASHYDAEQSNKPARSIENRRKLVLSTSPSSSC